eukprot:TRINITY_DN10415_c0_g1_i1.p1 TRINITY_DN10415_c0_g1~~TRINITY_DN10415_c0_g1_i1.p1  ORF type:complete len:938 (+),score=322.63 TRINITY_DN10415_c0_g1_i1:89-2902(+)
MNEPPTADPAPPSQKPTATQPGDLLEVPPALDLSEPLIGLVSASVLATFQHEVYLSFKHQDKEETAVFCPGRMFINGSTNLLSVAKSKEILRHIFKEKMEFEVMVQPFSSSWEVMMCSSGEEVVVVRPEAKSEVEARLANKAETTVTRTIGWAVTALVRGEQPSVQQLHNAGHVFTEQEEGWNRVIDRVHKELFGGEIKEEEEEEEKVEDNWFLVHVDGMTPSNVPETYPDNTKSGVKGVIKEIHRPFGGIIDVGAKNGGLVKFHRNALIKDGFRLGLTEVLEESVILGKSVLVDISENSNEEEKKIFTEFKGSKIATAVYIGDVPDTIEDHPELKSHGQVGHKIRVVELYPDSTGKVTSGLGTIQVSQIIRSGGAAASMVGEWVTFKLEDLFFYGVRLVEGVDLSYLLAVGDEIHCQLKMLDTKVGRAQFVVKIGWLSKLAGSVRSHLLPECAGLHKWCEKKGVDWGRMERRVQGKVDSKADSATENMAVGNVYDLEPAENNETVSKGLIKIEVGPHKGKMVRFNRSKAFLFGQSLEKADLLYVVRPHDQVYCEVSGIGDYPSGQYVSQKVHFQQPSEDKTSNDPMENMTREERSDYLVWLSIHNNKFKDFKDTLLGKSTNRYFIPFPRDPLPGRVVCFDPVRTNKYGCTSGTIMLEASTLNLEVEDLTEGQIGVRDMKDVKVTFHRACFWVYGRKMAKADLSYVVQPNQRVMVECKKITADDRKLHSSLPLDIDYRATVIWIGPSRPRNDREDPNRNDTGIFQWLGKRGLNIAQFTKLVEGRLPPHSPHELDHNNFFLPPMRGEGASTTSMDLISRSGQPELMPVLRHGPVIAHILDTAIASQGPADPRLFTLLENDEMAQAAHHVSEALRYSIQYYKEATANLRGGGFGMGYGPAGPQGGRGGHGKRPYDDYANFGGGYSRPPSKQQRHGWGGY